MRNEPQCESCLMPLSADKGPRESDRYCSYCFRDGDFTYTGDNLKEFQKLSYAGMRSQGMNPIKAWVFAQAIRFAPRWKKKK